MNTQHARDTCKAALRVRDHLLRAANDRVCRQSDHFGDLNYLLINLAHAGSLLRRACRLGYHGAAVRLLRRIDRLSDDLRRHLDALPPRHHVYRSVPTAPQLAGELRQIEEEFGAGSWQFDEQVLTVRTEPVRLEDIHLGPFSIELDLPGLGRFAGAPGAGQHPFRVLALDPHPAAGNRHITHPHVSDERLCTGEASYAVSSALMDGRLADFFLIVRGLLQTYNPDSPYVPLDAWEGITCHDCGECVHEDDRYTCDQCDLEFCSGCVGTCHHCDDGACFGCLHKCEHCEEYHCNTCMKACGACGEPCCVDCLEDNLCPSCNNDKENELEDPEPIEDTPDESGHEVAATPEAAA